MLPRRITPILAGVYCITNRQTGERYVGQSNDLHRRVRANFGRLRLGRHHNKRLQQSYNLHGKEAFGFEFLAVMPDGLNRLEAYNWLAERERFHVKELPTCFNLTSPPSKLVGWSVSKGGFICNCPPRGRPRKGK